MRVQIETHILNDIHAFRYRGSENPTYALVVAHGLASHAGIYDIFCTHHASRGADIWSFDAPGHGRSTSTRPRGQWTLDEWVDVTIEYAEHVKKLTGLPVFTLGSSLGIAAAYSALKSDAIEGAILMGSVAIPSTPWMERQATAFSGQGVKEIIQIFGRSLRVDCSIMFNFDTDYGYNGAAEQKRLDPWTTWVYDLESWASYFTHQPPIPISENRKPILIATGEKDPNWTVEIVKSAASQIAGPVELKIFEGAGHQLMLFHTEQFSDAVQDFVLRQIERN